MELDQLPIVDWKLGIKLAGGKKDLAQDLLTMFVPSLPNEISDFHQLYSAQKYKELLQRVHKIHGALAYLGLPRLKTLIARIESELKSNIMSNLPSHLIQLDAEINLVLEHFSDPSS